MTNSVIHFLIDSGPKKFDNIMLCFYVFLLLFWNANARFRYDYKYNRLADGWLKLHRIPATFNDAFFRCDQEGALLASPSDEGLLEALKQVCPKVLTGMYTGIHATISPGDYTTIEGIPLERIPVEWACDEPQYYSLEEGCLIMLDNGSLVGVRCNETYPFVCYKKKAPSLVMNECGTFDDDIEMISEYKLDSGTGSCYKFHRHSLTWRKAQSVCLAEGGYLAIINGEDELEVMKSLFEKNPEEKIIGSINSMITAVGALDWGKTGQWYTVHGQKLEDTGFNRWFTDTPDNITVHDPTGEHCISLFRSMVYNDIPCDVLTFAFICEKDPKSLISVSEW